MLPWIKGNPIIAGIIAAIVLALGVALITGWFGHKTTQEERHENALVNLGAVQERAAQQQETINAVIEAQRPVSASELNRVCDKYDRNCPHGP
jgi:flagellar basal body-associated protein FliL